MHANSQWNPSSREMNSFDAASPDMSPLFFNQKIEQKLPEKKIPSTAAKAINVSMNEALSTHFRAHSAFFFTAGMVSIPLNSFSFSSLSLTYVSINSE